MTLTVPMNMQFGEWIRYKYTYLEIIREICNSFIPYTPLI